MKNQIIENYNGLNWSLNDGVVNFFGSKGRKLNKGWLINALGGDMWVEVSADSMMPAIRTCIENDVTAGNADRIAQLHIGPRQAVVLFLEGKITAEHLMKATEPQWSDFISIPGVDIDDRTVTVRIIPGFPHRVATADSNGIIL